MRRKFYSLFNTMNARKLTLIENLNQCKKISSFSSRVTATPPAVLDRLQNVEKDQLKHYDM